jgi:hypothetical protein
MKHLEDSGHVMEAVDILKQAKGRKIPLWFKVLDVTLAVCLFTCVMYAYYELFLWLIGR